MLRSAKSKEFNPYTEWLKIPLREQPADHYTLLGIKRFESNDTTIQLAADARMAYLRTFQSGKRNRESESLLNEVAEARVCLLDHKLRAEYDQALRQNLKGLALRPLPQKSELISPKEIPDESPEHIKQSIPSDPVAWLQPWKRSRITRKQIERWVLPTIFGLLCVALLVVALVIQNSNN